MSTHYSATPRQIQASRFLRFVGYVVIPTVLIAGAANAWADGERRMLIVFASLANDYLAMCVAYTINRKHPFQEWFLILGVEVILFALASGYFYTAGDLVNTVIWMSGFLLLIISFLIRHHNQLKQLSRPIPTSIMRAIDYPGIYRITCSANQMEYIGQTSRAIKMRWHDHESDLNAGRHHNPRLQLDWNRYGESAFVWEVLEVVTDPIWLFDRERYWQNLNYETARRYNPPNIPRGR